MNKDITLQHFVQFSVFEERGYWHLEWMDRDYFNHHSPRKYVSGESVPNPLHPVQLRIRAGKKRMDFLGNISIPIVSQHVVDLFTQKGFTGWKTYPVEIFEKSGEPIREQFFGLAIHGRGGPADLSQGVVKWTDEDEGVRVPLQLNGLYFDLSKWDKSDIFLLNGSIRTLASRQVIEAFTAAKFKGWYCTELSDVRL